MSGAAINQYVGKVVGVAEAYSPADGSYGELTRWGRITGGMYAGGEQWFSIEPLHDQSVARFIRAKRIHTFLPKAY